MSEWSIEHAWKACVGETLPWVRIPLSPPPLARARSGGAGRLAVVIEPPALPRLKERIPAVDDAFHSRSVVAGSSRHRATHPVGARCDLARSNRILNSSFDRKLASSMCE